eukprot:7014689-Ditylum_brightwellii.AAC.1
METAEPMEGQSKSWVHLEDIKESHLIKVPCTLKKCDIIISSVKARVRKTTHKYGIEIPTIPLHAYEIDVANVNIFWQDAIRKEMTNIGIAFKILENDINIPSGRNMVTGHIIFDIKIDFTRSARWVVDGQKNKIQRTLYGGKSAGKDFCNHVRESIRYLGFISCPADPDVWMRLATHSDGFKNYEEILLHVDDILAIEEHPGKLLCQGICK